MFHGSEKVKLNITNKNGIKKICSNVFVFIVFEFLTVDFEHPVDRVHLLIQQYKK